MTKVDWWVLESPGNQSLWYCVEIGQEEKALISLGLSEHQAEKTQIYQQRVW